MAVSAGYLAKLRRSLRVVGESYDINTEIEDLVEECRLDLMQLGVLSTKANDEADRLIYGAVRGFVRWKFGLNNPAADRLHAEYDSMRDELRRRGDYCTTPTD